MSDYNVKECPCEACKKARAAEQPTQPPTVNCECHIDSILCEIPGHGSPLKPLTGDAQIVERMLDAWYGDTEGLPPYDSLQRSSIAAALAVAREGYVSLEDVLDSLSKDEIAEIEHIFGDCSKQQIDYLISSRRARLAKPAEQTDEQKVADILNDSMLENSNDLSRRHLAKKIVAALKAGKQ